MPDDLRGRIINHLADAAAHGQIRHPYGPLPLAALADVLLPFIRGEVERVPPRVRAAEDRQHFRDILAQSSLGDPEVVETIEQYRCYKQALPDRWVSLRRVDFIGLIEFYRERREVHNEDHDDALDHILAEVDFEPNQSDLSERRLD